MLACTQTRCLLASAVDSPALVLPLASMVRVLDLARVRARRTSRVPWPVTVEASIMVVLSEITLAIILAFIQVTAQVTVPMTVPVTAPVTAQMTVQMTVLAIAMVIAPVEVVVVRAEVITAAGVAMAVEKATV